MEAADNVEHSRHLRIVEASQKLGWIAGYLATAEGGRVSEKGCLTSVKSFTTLTRCWSRFARGVQVCNRPNGFNDRVKGPDTLVRHLDPNGNEVINYGDFTPCKTVAQTQLLNGSVRLGSSGSSPLQWEEMREGDRVVRIAGNWEEFKATETGERYFFNALTGESQWEKPYEVAVLDQQARDAKELEQAQTAASLAARSAAEAAAQAERASDKSIDKLVRSLASSSTLNLLAEQLHLDERVLREVKDLVRNRNLDLGLALIITRTPNLAMHVRCSSTIR